MSTLATIECPAEGLAGAIGTAALDGPGSEPHEEMYARVTAEGFTTPASAAETSQASFCTMAPAMFDGLTVTEPVEALFPVRTVLDWLSWFGEETIELAFLGEPGAAVAAQLRLSGADQTVVVDCVDEPAVLEEIRLWLPGRFDGATFLDGDGDPAPTRVETTTGELRQMVAAVDNCAGVEGYPLTVAGERLGYELDGETSTVSGTLEATVDGPDVAYRYGPGLQRVARTLSGPVTLQWTTTGQLAVVQDRPAVTFRYVLQPAGE